MNNHQIVSRQEWLAARKELLAGEKQLTRLRDHLNQQRRNLPWVRVDKDYAFTGPLGEVSLAGMFAGRSQLIVYHFMFGPDWQEGCPSCSFWADNFDGIGVHLRQRDINMVAVSRAPLAQLEAYKKRMGWSFPWLSSLGNEFNFDYHVSFTEQQLACGEVLYNYEGRHFPQSEAPGVSVFCKDEDGAIFHTYSCYARGLDMLNGAYHYMDLAPKGRDEAELSYSMAWVRRHDEYA